jgi:hypothetical protein
MITVSGYSVDGKRQDYQAKNQKTITVSIAISNRMVELSKASPAVRAVVCADVADLVGELLEKGPPSEETRCECEGTDFPPGQDCSVCRQRRTRARP